MLGRFLSHVARSDDEGSCWLWTGAVSHNGYGLFWASKDMGGLRPAHRWAYALWRSSIPVGLQLDHLCRNRACVNPDHLEPVTGRENRRRGKSMTAENSRKTECKNGHPFDEANTRIVMRKGTPRRYCRTCSKEATARWRLRQSEAAA